MTPLAVQNLILSGLTTFGSSILVIVGSVLTIAIAYLVFSFGYTQIRTSLNGGEGPYWFKGERWGKAGKNNWFNF